MHSQILVLSVVFQVASGLIAYDCRGPSTNITTISLRDVAACPDPEKDYEEHRVEVQVIQENEYKNVHVHTCLVEVTRNIQHCGMHSHTSAVHQGLLTYVHEVGADECKQMHYRKCFRGISNQIIQNLNLNGTTTVAVNLAGKLSLDGKCSGASYSENGITWENVVVQASMKISLKDYKATVRLEQNEIFLSGGVICPFLDGYCVDTNIGETVWDRIIIDSCDDTKFVEIYRGEAIIVVENKHFKGNKQQYLVIEEGDKVFALKMLESKNICNQEFHFTEHPNLFIIKNQFSGYKYKVTGVQSSKNVNLMTYLNTKFLYVEQAFKTEMRNIYTDIIHKQCLIQRDILKNRLLMAPLSPNAASTLIKNKLGYIGRVLGEVMHIMQCTPRVVRIRRVEECYNELPVSADDENLFMTPLTHILQNKAEQVDCSDLTSSLYFLENKWLGFTPDVNKDIDPEIIEVDQDPKFNFKPLYDLGNSGIYTKNEIKTAQESLIFGLERQAVTNLITRRVIGRETENQGLNTLDIFSKKELENFFTSKFKQIWGWLSSFGLVMSGFVGIYFIFGIVKYVFETLMNAYSLYNTIGCTFGLIACVWNSLTNVMLQKQNRKAYEERQKQNQDIEMGIRDQNVHQQQQNSNNFLPSAPPESEYQRQKWLM